MFYTPHTWRGKAANAKQGSSDESIDINYKYSFESECFKYKNPYEEALKTCELAYNKLIKMNVCPEQARMVLPQSMYTSYYVTGSLSAFARAYKLRIDKHAQKEIQELAEKWNAIIKALYPVSWEALTEGQDK
jgi:thymidylate synthase (FAD)